MQKVRGRAPTNPIESRCVCRDIGQWCTVGTNPRVDTSRSGEGEIGGNLTHFLHEREEVGAVLGTDGVTADTLLARILPASGG